MQPKNRMRVNALTELLLLAILQGGAVSLAGLCGSASEGRRFLKEVSKFTEPQIQRALNNLRLAKFIQCDSYGKTSPIVLTEKGLRRAQRSELKLLAVNRPERWDHLWRVVMFDIPEKKKIRRAFSRELRNLGFYPLQRSVFVFPADCSRLIDEICKLYGLEHHVLVLLAGSLGKRENEAKKFFFASPK